MGQQENPRKIIEKAEGAFSRGDFVRVRTTIAELPLNGLSQDLVDRRARLSRAVATDPWTYLVGAGLCTLIVGAAIAFIFSRS